MVSYPPSFQTFKWKIPIYIYECVACFKRRFCVILYSKRAIGEQETQITQFRRSHNNAISWSSSPVLLAVRTAPADSQRTGGRRHLPTRLTAPVRNSVYVLLAKTVLIPSVSRTSHRPAGYHFRYSYEIWGKTSFLSWLLLIMSLSHRHMTPNITIDNHGASACRNYRKRYLHT